MPITNTKTPGGTIPKAYGLSAASKVPNTSGGSSYQNIQQPAQQSTTQSAYQQLVSQPTQPGKWYKGDTPTTSEIYGRIRTIGQTNPQAAQQIAIGFAQAQQDKTSQWYDPYVAATNQAVNNLKTYGVDVNSLTDEWFEQNNGWQNNLRYSSTTNSPLAPTKKSGIDEIISYNIYQYKKSEDQTKKAENEWSALQYELTNKANRSDRNYSDDEIIGSIDWNKYPTLQKMMESKALGSPIELNRAVNFSDDSMRGVLWAARNNGGTGSIYSDMALSALGEGNQYVRNDELRAKLDAGNVETYAPYSVGLCGKEMEAAALYFGTDKFNRQWLADNRAAILGGNDETAKKHYANVAEAIEYSEKLEEQLKSMNERIDRLMKYYNDPEKIMKALKNDTEYKDLFDLDKTMENGTALKNTAYAINYRWRDMEQEIRKRCEEKNSKAGIGDLTGSVGKTVQTTPEVKTEEPTQGETAPAETAQSRPITIDVVSGAAPVSQTPGMSTFAPVMPEAAPAEEQEPKKKAMDVWSEALHLANKKNIEPLPNAQPGENEIQKLPNEIDKTERGEVKLQKLPNIITEADKEQAKAAYDEKYGEGAFERDLDFANTKKIEQPGLAPMPEPSVPELYTESEKAIDDAVVADMDAISGTVEDIGTTAEKTAIQTGKTTLFEKGVQFLKDLKGDFVNGLKNLSTDNVARNYMGNYQVINDYEGHLANRDKAQEQLDEITPEYEELIKKREANAAIANLTTDEYMNLVAFGNVSNPEWSLIRADLDRGPGEEGPYSEPSPMTVRYNTALEALYQIVTGTEMPTDERGNVYDDAVEQTKLWYAYLNKKTPVQELVSDANKYGEGNDEEEVEQGNMLIRMEKNEDGQYVFSEAKDLDTGVTYGPDRENEVNELLGYTDTTQEDLARIEDLGRLKSALETEIQDENDYLGAYEEDYQTAQMDNRFLADAYEAASVYSDGNTDPGLINKIENLYNVSITPVKREYPSYNLYDVAVEKEGYDRETVSKAALESATSLQTEIDSLSDTMSYLDSLGVPFEDAQRRNIEANLSNMRDRQSEAVYSSLDGNDDFRSVIDDTLKNIKQMNVSPGALALASYYQNGGTLDLLNMNGFDPRGSSLLSINKEEMDRYFYILGKDGEEAASKYLSFLCDPNNGTLTARSMENMQTGIREFAGENALNAAIATGLSFVSNMASAPSSIVYRIGQAIKGEDVSPINEAYQAKAFTAAARQGSKDFLGQLADSDSILGQLIVKGYDIAAGLVDYKVGSAAMGKLFEGIGVSLKPLASDGFGIKILKSAGEVIPSTLNSAEATFQSVLTETGDETKAGQMAAVSFATGLLSHAVVMQGVHSAFQANPKGVTDYISGLFNQVLKTDAAVGISGLTTNTINAIAEKAILGADSEWQKNYDKYYEIWHSDSIAKDMADQAMKDKIFSDTLNEIANATLRTAVTYTAGAVKNSEPVQKAFRKIETAWNDLKAKAETVGAKAKGTYTEEAVQTDGLTTFGSVKDTVDGITDTMRQTIPDDAILNPVDGVNGTIVYDRTTGKAHNIVAYMTMDDGNILFIDDAGEQVPFLNIAVQNGGPAENLTDGEWALLTYGWNSGKAKAYAGMEASRAADPEAENPDVYPGEFTQGTVDDGRAALMAGTETPEATVPQTESQQTEGQPIVMLPPTGTQPEVPQAEAPVATINLPIQNKQPVLAPQRNAKDLTILTGTYNAKPETATTGIAAVLSTGDEHTDKAAAQNMVGEMAYGDTRVSAMVMQQIIKQAGEDTDPEALRNDLAQAAITKGAGHDALANLFEKTRNGKVVTAEDVQAVCDGIAQDRQLNPDAFKKELDSSVKENRIANRTNQIASRSRKKIEASEKKVESAKEDVNRAENGLNQANAVLQTTVQNVTRAANTVVNDANNNNNVADVEQEANKIPGATTVVQQREEQVQIEKQKLAEAQAEHKETQESIMTEARAQATTEVNHEMEEEQKQKAAALEAGNGNSITVNPGSPGGSPPPNNPDDGKKIAATVSADAQREEQRAERTAALGAEDDTSVDVTPNRTAALDAGTDEQSITVEANPQRQFGSQTAQKYDVLEKEVKDWLKEHSDRDVDSNSDQINRALTWVQSHANEDDPNGYHGTVNEVLSDDFDTFSVDGQVRLQVAMAMAAGRGDTETELKIADAYNKGRTQVARMLQAGNVFRMLSPAARAESLQKEEDKINKELESKGKDYRVKLPKELIERASNATTKEEFDEIENEAKRILYSQLPVTWGDRILGWRMLSMLSAPKTHARNVVGNLLFVPVVGIKNKVGAAIELAAQATGGIDKSERTKTIGLANPEARAFAKDDAPKVEDILRGNAKYKEGKGEKPIFGTKDNIISKTVGKALQKWYDFNGKLLEWEDWLFLKGHYKRALSGYMTARGLKPEDMTDKVLDEAREYAVNEAQKATYRDKSAVADWMNKINVKGKSETNSKGLAVLQWFVNARLPFKRTPINIAKRGIEYSPVGLGKSMTYDAIHLKQYLNAEKNHTKAPNSAISPTQFIDKFASGLTGSGLLAAGVIAAAYGIARAGFDKNDPEDTIDKMAGEQEYSIKPGKLVNNVVNAVGQKFDPEFSVELMGEDVSMSLDWAAPVSLPFFTGVALKEQLEKEGLGIGDTLDIIMEITDPMLNMSFMEGVNDLFKTNAYSDKDSIWQVVEKTALSYATSMIPTWMGQLAQTVDPVRRTTYIDKNATTGDADLDRTIQQIQNKIPWVGMAGIPYTNALGEKPERVIPAVIENMLSPAYFSKVDDSNEMEELKRLYKEKKDKTILPSEPSKSFTVDKKTVNLTAKQYEQLKEDHGKIWRETVQALIENPLYAYASDDSKAAMWNLADDYATQISKSKLGIGTKVDSWAESAYKKGNAADAIVNKIAQTNKSYYVQDKAKSLAESLFMNNDNDIATYVKEIEEAKASPTDVRKALTAYFKPLYIEAYNNSEEDIMFQIEDILTNINDVVTLGKTITKYTKKKDFEKWIESPNTVSDEEEDEDENNWLNIGDE